jgi:hypothetical protein
LKDLYNENGKIESTRGWKVLPCSWIDRNIVEMTIIVKAMHRFNAIPVNIKMSFLIEIEKSILKFICK